MDNNQFLTQPQIFDYIYADRLEADEIFVNKLSALSANFINLILELLKLSAIKVEELTATNLSAGRGVLYNIESYRLTGYDAYFPTLTAVNSRFFNEYADNSRIFNLQAQNLTAFNLDVKKFAADEIRVPTLSARNALFNNLSAQSLTAISLTSTKLNAYTGYYEFLTAKNFFSDTFDLSSLKIPYISATNIDVVNLTAQRFYNNFSDIGTIDVRHQYLSANVDLLSAIDRPYHNVLFVSVSGNDLNSGRNPLRSLRTIKKACEIAHNDRVVSNGATPKTTTRYTINVMAGEYYENNPIYVPSHVSLIGDNLRRCSVFPLNRTYDILWLDNSSYIWGFTFRNHLHPSAATAFPDLGNATLSAIAYQNLNVPANPNPGGPSAKFRRPYITTSPYVQGSSSISQGDETLGLSAGMGMRVDGSLAEGFLRSMVLDSYTQFNEGGKGIYILNNGYAQLVSIFTICCTEGIICESGGVCSISNSNCSFGLSGVVAIGKSPVPVLSAGISGFALFGEETPGTTRTIKISGVQGAIIQPNSDYYPQFDSSPIPVSNRIDTRRIAYAPYNGLIFTLQGDENTTYSLNTSPYLSGSEWVLDLTNKINTSAITQGRGVKFYIRSTAYASSHTFEFVGSGVVLRKAVPALGGQAIPEDEVRFADGGEVFYTSTNHTGDFSVGEEFRIVQSTGTIEGRTFQRAILTLITPLTLAVE